MAMDKFTIEILADGKLKVSTDRVSAANHVNAENFIKAMFRMAGGAVEVRHKHGKRMHYHAAANMASLEAGGADHSH